MIGEKEEGNEANSQSSKDVKVNIKAPGDPCFRLAEVFIPAAAMFTHLTQ